MPRNICFADSVLDVYESGLWAARNGNREHKGTVSEGPEGAHEFF